jgi:phospholipid/cholesterol/gamma-HCH transport system permease protein
MLNQQENKIPSEQNQSLLSMVYHDYMKAFFIKVADLTLFILRILKEAVMPPYELAEITKQCYAIGYKSLSLIATTGFIMGLVLTIQSRPTLVEFGAESWLPAMVGVSIIREIGPVITALICAGKVGSGIGAELASMKVTEQIDAMEVSGINPFKYVITTRVIATTLMVPLLVVFSDAVGVFGSYVGANIKGDINIRLFFIQAFEQVDFSDVFPSIIKSLFFGFTIGVVACHKGYYSNKGTEGVGIAANAAVVVSSLMIFILDMLAVQVTDLIIGQ